MYKIWLMLRISGSPWFKELCNRRDAEETFGGRKSCSWRFFTSLCLCVLVLLLHWKRLCLNFVIPAPIQMMPCTEWQYKSATNTTHGVAVQISVTADQHAAMQPCSHAQRQRASLTEARWPNSEAKLLGYFPVSKDSQVPERQQLEIFTFKLKNGLLGSRLQLWSRKQRLSEAKDFLSHFVHAALSLVSSVALQVDTVLSHV